MPNGTLASLFPCCCTEKEDYIANEELWNAAINETLLGANRGTPPFSRALCPVSRYPLRYCSGVRFGGVAMCARSGVEVKLNQPHFMCEESNEVVCLQEGPRVYIDHEYDVTSASTQQHTIQQMFSVPSGRKHAYEDRGTTRGVDMLDPEGTSVAKQVLQKIAELAEEIEEEDEDVFDKDWLVGEKLIEMTAHQVQVLANAAQNVLARQDILVEAAVPCVVLGDTHGQLRDILIFFREYGWPGKPDGRHFVFNGDFVDRGSHQLEVAMLVLALKVIYPTRVWLVRGNHEDKTINVKYGFTNSCIERYGPQNGMQVFDAFHYAFDQLPLACLVGGQVLVLHGGIGRGDWSFNEMRSILRPITTEKICQNPFIFNTLWSDPIEDDDPNGTNNFGLHQSPRGKSAVKFGWDVTYDFCQRNNIGLVIRSHQAKKNGFGFDVMHEMMLMRVFTARDYDKYLNDGAILLIEELHDGLLKVRPQVVRSLNKEMVEEEESP